MQDPLDATLMDSKKIQGPKAQDGGATPKQFLEVDLFELFPLTPDEFDYETDAIGKIISLAFHPYKERPHPSPYAAWATVLVQPVPGIRI